MSRCGVSKGRAAARWATYSPRLTRLARLAECDLGADRHFLILGERGVPPEGGGSGRAGGAIGAPSRGFGRFDGLGERLRRGQALYSVLAKGRQCRLVQAGPHGGSRSHHCESGHKSAR